MQFYHDSVPGTRSQPFTHAVLVGIRALHMLHTHHARVHGYGPHEITNEQGWRSRRRRCMAVRVAGVLGLRVAHSEINTGRLLHGLRATLLRLLCEVAHDQKCDLVEGVWLRALETKARWESAADVSSCLTLRVAIEARWLRRCLCNHCVFHPLCKVNGQIVFNTKR